MLYFNRRSHNHRISYNARKIYLCQTLSAPRAYQIKYVDSKTYRDLWINYIDKIWGYLWRAKNKRDVRNDVFCRGWSHLTQHGRSIILALLAPSNRVCILPESSGWRRKQSREALYTLGILIGQRFLELSSPNQLTRKSCRQWDLWIRRLQRE